MSDVEPGWTALGKSEEVLKEIEDNIQFQSLEIVCYIYALVDPRTHQIRYIGKSKDPDERYRKHLKPYYLKPETHKNRWLRKLLSMGLKPLLIVICEADETEDINQIERDFIRWLGRSRNLTNGTKGGDGGATMTGKKLPFRPSTMKGVAWLPDDPRREQIRNRHQGEIPWQATNKAIEKNKHYWRITSPEGVVFETHGLQDIARENGLMASKLAAVARGEAGRKHHKGWTCVRIEEK